MDVNSRESKIFVMAQDQSLTMMECQQIISRGLSLFKKAFILVLFLF